ncbi:MAG: hypothetical protein IPL72_18820 [Sulfuritalea sp.]|nr:hypothetical protein [Sulfuritalea sp.]
MAWVRDIVKVLGKAGRQADRLTGVFIDFTAPKASAIAPGRAAERHQLSRSLIDSVPG